MATDTSTLHEYVRKLAARQELIDAIKEQKQALEERLLELRQEQNKLIIASGEYSEDPQQFLVDWRVFVVTFNHELEMRVPVCEFQDIEVVD